MDGLARLNDIYESAVRNRPDPRSNLRKLNNEDPLFGSFLHLPGMRFGGFLVISEVAHVKKG